MCLRFTFLLITRVASWLRLSQRAETWKTAEILILRHQLAVLQRRQPRRPNLNWADRALIAALLGVIPKARLHGCGCWSPPTRSRAVVKKAGIDPAPQWTGPTWSQFLGSQAEAILACDFFTADLLDGAQAHVLAVIEHATRRIRILSVTQHPTGEWTTQQARNLLMDLGEQAHRVKFMIRDRGSNFTAAFDAVLADAGIRTVLCNVRTPRMNAI